jgi:hypothetical protein
VLVLALLGQASANASLSAQVYCQNHEKRPMRYREGTSMPALNQLFSEISGSLAALLTACEVLMTECDYPSLGIIALNRFSIALRGQYLVSTGSLQLNL